MKYILNFLRDHHIIHTWYEYEDNDSTWAHCPKCGKTEYVGQ